MPAGAETAWFEPEAVAVPAAAARFAAAASRRRCVAVPRMPSDAVADMGLVGCSVAVGCTSTAPAGTHAGMERAVAAAATLATVLVESKAGVGSVAVTGIGMPSSVALPGANCAALADAAAAKAPDRTNSEISRTIVAVNAYMRDH